MSSPKDADILEAITSEGPRISESDATLDDADDLFDPSSPAPLFDDDDDDSFAQETAAALDSSREHHDHEQHSLNHASSKKKKSSPQSAAMNNTNSSHGGDRGPQGENTGRWTAEEHSLFLQGLEQHGKGWKKIAQLIKSRTVVQIRTHAQKYFQKMTKARQNGEEGEVIMEGRGGVSSVASVSPTAVAQTTKRRRPATGTKRKAIHSVVSSAIRQGKKMAAAQVAAGVKNPTPPLPSVAPILANFLLPPQATAAADGRSSTATKPTRQFEDQTTISGPALEDSIFRFLTPAPIFNELPQHDVARQAGANPITVPSGKLTSAAGGEVSPTGVSELSTYPSWVDGKDPPSWYAKGADVDALLDVSDTLDWLADTGDMQETYQPTSDLDADMGPAKERLGDLGGALNNTSVATLPHVESVVPPLPALFGDATTTELKKPEPTVSASLKLSTSSTSMDEHLQVFESSMEEHDFVSTILETTNESSASLPALNLN